MVSLLFLAKLNDSITGFQSRFDPRPQMLNGREKHFGAAVPESNPDEPRFGREGVGQIKEIFILADNNAIVPTGVLPDCGIGGATQVEVENMLTFDAREDRKRARAAGSWLSTRNFTTLAEQCDRLDGPRTQ
jgi:hypothetical protein